MNYPSLHWRDGEIMSMSNGKILSSISICIGTIVGITCARYVPSSFIIEVSLAVGVALLVMHRVRREKSSRKSLPSEIICKHNSETMTTIVMSGLRHRLYLQSVQLKQKSLDIYYLSLLTLIYQRRLQIQKT